MSRRSNCWDNAPGESIFSRIKDDLVYRRIWETREQAKGEIEEYIESFYNEKRRHSFIDYQSPNDFEKARQLLQRAA